MEQQVGTAVRARKRKDGAESIGLSLVQVVEFLRLSLLRPHKGDLMNIGGQSILV